MFGLTEHALVAPWAMAMMAVARPASAADFDGDVVLAIQMIQPHFLRAMQVRQRLDSIGLERQQALDALDRLEQGVLLVDAQARVRHANRPAEALLGGGLSAVADRLSVRLSTVRTLVQRAFAKTGAHHQAELVRLITSPAPPADDEA